MWKTLFFGAGGRLWAMALLLAASLVLPAPLAKLDNARHTYLIQADGQPTIIEGTAQESLDYDTLHVRPSRSAAWGDAQFLLRNGQRIALTAKGRTETVTARNETVDHLLRRMDVQVGDRDMVSLDVRGSTLSITVSEHWDYIWEEVHPTTYKTERVANPALKQGVEQVKQEGQDGEYVETFRNAYRDGKLSYTTLVSRSEDTAVTEIVEYGTAVSYVQSSDRIAEVHPDEDGSGGYLVFTSGATMPYTKIMDCNATAYNIHGKTATGYPTEVGVVAVDPKVIPYGTRMFIQTPSGSWVYGMSVARDCGGAIKGNIIDLWFPDYETCAKWGRRDVTVYILG